VAQDQRITTIVLGKGEHVVEALKDERGHVNNILCISSAMSIVGRPNVPKEQIVVLGGIYFAKGIQGNCHLQHLTLRQAKGCGVWGKSSFTVEDVLVEQCSGSGVYAYGTGGSIGGGVVGRCTNVEVRQCGDSGVVAHKGGSITLIGAKTTVHHNCTRKRAIDFGLAVYESSSSTIQLVSPLTKKQVAIDNGGGGNWGATRSGDVNQIKTIDGGDTNPSSTTIADTSSVVSVVAFKLLHVSSGHVLVSSGHVTMWKCVNVERVAWWPYKVLASH